MSGRTFRNIHSSKMKSSSTTFSLHFNKADEDQIEISYSGDSRFKKNVCESNTDQKVITSYVDSKDSTTLDKDPEYNVDKKENHSCHGLTPSVVSSDSPNISILDSCHSTSKTLLKLKSGKATKIQTQNKKSSSCSTIANSFVESDGDAKFHAYPLSDTGDFSKEQSENINNENCSKYFLTEAKKIYDPRASEITHQSFPVEKKIVPEIANVEKMTSVTENSTSICDSLKTLVDYIDAAKNNVNFPILLAVIVCLLGPLPSWMSGFFIGIILSSSLFYWLYKPFKKSRKPPSGVIKTSYKINDVNYPTNAGIFKGWMNELPENLNYIPERYHSSFTRSVYVRLDGSYLRLSLPLKNIPRRSMFNERRYDLQFICQQHFDLTGASIELLPKGLSKKRLWSKNYPIYLRIPNSKESVLSIPSKSDGQESNQRKKFTPRVNECNEIVIYLFSRTDRDKHLWFSRFSKASKIKISKPHFFSSFHNADSLSDKRAMSADFTTLHFNAAVNSDASLLDDRVSDSEDFIEININKHDKFEIYMSNLLSPLSLSKKDCTNPGNLNWLNALMGRFFFDILGEVEWTELVTHKIQKKLNKLKLPFFLTELIVKDIHLGTALPKINQASDPLVDERGLWIYLDLTYNGSFHMTLETKLNLLKFQGSSEDFWTSLSDVSKDEELADLSSKSPVSNSDEDSAESFTDNDLESNASDVSTEGLSKSSKSGRLLKFVDRLAQSHYVKSATKNKYVKRAMEDLSKKPLLLTVEVQWLTGTLALNIPPWPSDRLWYGFQGNPSLSITARPKLGQHTVTLPHVTEWIEKKLISEFQKVLVIPNMDDLIIPIMQSDLEME